MRPAIRVVSLPSANTRSPATSVARGGVWPPAVAFFPFPGGPGHVLLSSAGWPERFSGPCQLLSCGHVLVASEIAVLFT